MSAVYSLCHFHIYEVGSGSSFTCDVKRVPKLGTMEVLAGIEKRLDLPDFFIILYLRTIS